jgi:hypothetical protein
MDVNIHLLLGGEKTLSEAVRQALELHAVLIAARSLRTSGGMHSDHDVETVERGRFLGRRPMQGQQQVSSTSDMTKGLQRTWGNR